MTCSKLELYKDLLDKNTNSGMGFEDRSKSRYQSFKICLDLLKDKPNAKILELGTCRSFVDGSFEGCNSDDPKYWVPNDYTRWDFGAGCFSLIFGQYGYNITTLDLIPSHIQRCKIMLDSLNVNASFIIMSSLDFLAQTNEKYDLIYLDTGDMYPIEPSEDLQEAEARLIILRNILKDDGVLLIDDVLNHTPRKLGNLENIYGKSTKSIPLLRAHNYNCLFEGYQQIWKK